jgi:predicted nucleic acid-binding protein
VPHLVDTNVAILVRDGQAEALTRIAGFEQVILSVITVVELEAGVHKDPSRAASRRARVDAMLKRWTLAPFTAGTASRYGAIVAELGYSRRLVLDRMIAATALELGATLVTANPADFADVPGLRVLAW